MYAEWYALWGYYILLQISILLDSGGRMSKEPERRLTPEQIKAIEDTVNRGDRAEVVPVKDGLKILRTRREEVKSR